MKEVSDRLVSVLFLLALFSVGGSIVVVLSSVGGDVSLLTGLATTGTGLVNVSVTGTAAITLINSTVNFTSGTLTGVATGTRINTSVCGGDNVGGFAEPCPIIVQNDGNTEVNISINGTPASVWLPSSTYEFAGAAGEGGCPTANLTTTRLPFVAAQTIICSNLTFSDAKDSFNIDIYLNLSSDLSVNVYEDTAVIVFADQHT